MICSERWKKHKLSFFGVPELQYYSLCIQYSTLSVLLSVLYMHSSTTVPCSETIAKFTSVHAACFEQPLHAVHTAGASEPCGDGNVLTHKTISSASTVVALQPMHNSTASVAQQ